MSRKKADLRLKKRPETTLLDSTTTSRVQVTAGNDEFRRVGLARETRVLLHKLLLGETPVTFTPFPPSKLCLNSATEERPADISKNFSEEEDNDDDKKLKWTPFPPSNVMDIIAKMPLVPLTMEQLCAPISDDDDEEEESKEKIGQDHKKDEKYNVPEQSMSTAPTVTTHNNKGITPGKSGEPSGVLTCRTVSDFIKSSRINHGHTSDSREPQRNSNNAQSTNSKSMSEKHLSKSETLGHDVIDLTDSYDQPSTSRPHSNSALQSHTSQSATSNTRTHNPFKLQDDDFNVLCTDVDLDTFDDFSDEDSEVAHSPTPDIISAPSGNGKSRYIEKQSTQRSPERFTSKGKSSVSGDSKLKKGAVATTSGSMAVSSHDRSTTKYGASLSKITYPSATVDPKKKCSGVKRSNDFDLVSRTKHPRLETTTVKQHVQQREAISTSSIIKPTGITKPTGLPESTMDHKSLYRHTTHDTEMSIVRSTSDTRVSTKVPRTTTDGELRPKSTTHSLTTQGPVTGGATQLTVAVHGTATNMPQRNTTRAQATSVCDTVSRTATAAATGVQVSTAQSTVPTSSRHEVAGSSRDGGVSRTTPLGSRLTTENCPLCNKKFSSWYEQVDADRHIAQCLQAVMNLGVEDDLDLF